MRRTFVLRVPLFQIFLECLQLVFEFPLRCLQLVNSLILVDDHGIQLLELVLQVRDERLEIDQLLQNLRGIRHVSSSKKNKIRINETGPIVANHIAAR